MCNREMKVDNITFGGDGMEYINEIRAMLAGNPAIDIPNLKEKSKTYEGKADGYLGIRECWRQIAILTMKEETACEGVAS